MPLSHLEHILVQTTDMEATRRWYVEVLGMRAGYTPDFKFPVCWLYIGERDVIHVTEGGAGTSANRKTYLGQHSEAENGTGVIDHIAFRAAGLGETLERLRRHKIDFKERQVADQGLYQVFFFDPNGIKIELNFEAVEATALGLTAGVKASELTT